MARKYSMEWYQEQAREKEKLTAHILARTRKEPNESAKDWLYRVNAIVQREHKKRGYDKV